MKEFIITETRPATVTWTYQVAAETEDEALELAINGEVAPVHFDYDIDYEVVPQEDPYYISELK
jgi:hypothetical protein